MKQIGIFAGSFNPIHAGHLSFALQASRLANLEHVVFLPERLPRLKPSIEHFGHRTAMIARAIRPYRNLSLLELPDIHFLVSKTLPKLKREFSGCQLSFLLGSDAVGSLKDWPDIEDLLSTSRLIISLKTTDAEALVSQQLALLPAVNCQIIKSQAPFISSGVIRQALHNNRPAPGLLQSVRSYARSQWLYASIEGTYSSSLSSE